MSAGIRNLLLILQEFNRPKFEKLLHGNEVDLDNLKYSELKNDLAKAIVNHFAPLRQKRVELLKNKKRVLKFYQEGAKKARAVAQKTLKEVKEKIGLI